MLTIFAGSDRVSQYKNEYRLKSLALSGDNEFQADRTRSTADDLALWKRFRGVTGEDAKVSTIQRMKLSANAAAPLGFHLPNLLPPDTRRGEALMNDIWRIGMERVVMPSGHTPWSAPLPSRHFADRLHRFAWLPDLASQGRVSEDRARAFVDDWIENFGRFDGFSWRVDVAATRAWNWMRCGEMLFDPEHAGSTERLENLLRQLRFLRETVDGASDARGRWMGACALVAMAVCTKEIEHLDETLHRLESECSAQILPDGGHVSRSPSRLLSALTHLLALKTLLKTANQPIPDYFDKWIPRMGSMVAFFRVPDGSLNPFNDGHESRPEAVSAAMERLDGLPRRFTFAPKSGFQKLEKNTLRLILDCGEAPERPFGDYAHAGALGFELSDGPARIVTSCGFSPEVNVDWQAAVRRTGAHSTLVLNGRDSASFVMNDETRILAVNGPEGISAKRLEESDEIWLDAQHSGYKSTHGLLHRRRLFMSGNGQRLTGEDALVRPVSHSDSDDRYFVNFEIRFHLHPTVTALMGKDAIRLICDDGTVWRFKTSHENARLERTIYLARGNVERPEQIVLAGRADPNGDGTEPPNCVRWAFLKEASL